MVPPKFKTWLHGQIWPVTKRDEGVCTHLTVRHVSGKNSSDVCRIQVPRPESIKENEEEEILQSLAVEAWEAAQTDADGFQGTNTYSIHSWFEGQPDRAVNRYTARFESSVEEDGNEDESASESPTKSGITSQMMRHTEAFARIGTQASIHQMSLQQRTIESQHNLIGKLVQDKLDTVQLIEDLIQQKHERAIEMKDAESKARFKSELIEAVGNYLPVVAGKMGMPLLPPTTKDGSTHPVRQLLASIKPEQMAALTQILSPDQQALVVQLMSEQEEAVTKEEEEAKTEH